MNGLLEPCALNRRMHGSEGRGGQQCPSLTRACRAVGSKVSDFTLPTRGRTASAQRGPSFTDTNARSALTRNYVGVPDRSAQTSSACLRVSMGPPRLVADGQPRRRLRRPAVQGVGAR